MKAHLTPAQKKYIEKKAAMKETARTEAEQFLPLSSLKNIAAVIAKTEIGLFGYYACKIDGVKTFVEA